jgi:nucleoside-triphosphatase THEP1
MARMFPQKPPAILREPARAAELKVYNAFQAGLLDDYTVFYSVRWIMKDDRGTPTTGEADFIVAHPALGLIVLEVKGGSIRKDGPSGQWFSVDGRNQQHAIKNPYEQAETNKFALIRRIKEHPAWRGRWIDAAHAVFFPGVGLNPKAMGLDAVAEITLTGADISILKSRIEGIYSFWQKRREFGPDGVSVLTKILAPSFEIRNPLHARIAETEQQILQLTDSQFEVLEMIAGTPRAIVSGGAGTGKTVLALRQAERLANDGFSVLFTCFSPTLARFLQHSAGENPNLHIRCFTDLVRELSEDDSLPKVDPLDMTGQEKKLFADALLDAVDRTVTRYDALIVDEGQDFIQDWWTSLEFLLSERKDGVFYIFYDNNQLIHQDDSALPKIPARLNLPDVVRNTSQISKFARAFYGGKALKDSPINGEEIRFLPAEAGATTARLDSLLTELISKERFRSDQIAVLVPRVNLDSVYNLEKIGNRPVVRAAMRRSDGIVIDTIGAFKGLDMPVVILCEIESVVRAGNLSIEQLYVGISRAKSLLIVVAPEKSLQILKKKLSS